MLPLCMSKEYDQDVFRNLHIPPENLLIQKVKYTHWSCQDHPFAQCNKSTSVTITPLFISHLNAGPKNKEAERKHYRYYYQKSLFAGKHRKTD